MKQKLLSFFVLFSLSIGLLHAQNRQVSGRVTDATTGAPLSGVSVKLVGLSTATQTDDQGNYSLTVNENGRLTFSFIGYESQTQSVSGKSILNISLTSIADALDEVVVVAYGTVSKKSHVGSSAQVSSKEIENRPLTNVSSALVGSAPGVQGTLSGGAPGSAANIRIRGFGSINASNNPLYVVDGIPYDGAVSNVNPDDVESISVLKDAATTALYGSRGANGVIMITTKKGKYNSGNFTANASAGIIRRGLPEYDRIDAMQYYPVMWQALKNSLVTNGLPDDIARQIASGKLTSYNGNNYTGIFSQLGYNPFNVDNDAIVDVNGVLNPSAKLKWADDLDWENEILSGGRKRQAYGITYDGGSEKSTYFANLGYTNDEGYLLKSSLKRINARANITTQATKWLRTGLNLNGNYNVNLFDNAGDGGTSFINPFFYSRNVGPIYPVHLHDPVTGELILDEFGERKFDFGDKRPFSPGRHALYENTLDEQRNVRSTLGGRTFMEIQILPQLKASTNIGLDVQDSHERYYDNPILGDGSPAGRAYHYLYRTTSYTWNQILEYNQSFNDHNVGLMVGHENYSYKYNR